MDSAKRVINGTFGEVWLEGRLVGEAIGLKAVSKFNKEKVNLAGQMEEDNKVTSISNTGSITLLKVDSRMALLIADKITSGVDVRFTIISALKDPDSYGNERVVLYNVSFDDLTLADWKTATKTDIEAPFTFTKFKFQDSIRPR